jgi:hypothetical protein
VYAGEAESPDGKAHVIDVKNADGFAARLFVDQRTRLPLMVTYQAPPPRVVTSTGRDPEARRSGGHAGEPTDEERRKAREEAEKAADLQNEPDPAVEHTLYFEDWQAAGGVRFPHKIRRAVAGTTSEEWTVNKVKVNPRIDPKKFQG